MALPAVIQLLVLFTAGSMNNPGNSLNTLQQNKDTTSTPVNHVLRVEMNLSAFGVESDNFPSVLAEIDFVKDSSYCRKTFYDPISHDFEYSLTTAEIETIKQMLQSSDLKKLRGTYTVALTDQPTSKMVIYTEQGKFEISDYGLKGDNPLPEIYKMVYKL